MAHLEAPAGASQGPSVAGRVGAILARPPAAFAKSGLKPLVGRLLPRQAKPALHACREYLRSSGEVELRLVPLLCDPQRLSVDVGSMLGYFAWWMQWRSARVVALEPHPELARKLKLGFGGKVEVRQLAASDHAGKATLWRSFIDGREIFGCSSVEVLVNLRYDHIVEYVDVMPVDELGLGPVGFMKIHTEGHDAAVLRGAMRTIRRDTPVLLVALEERFRRGLIAETARRLGAEGYEGWFIWRRELMPIAGFDRSLHQRPEAMPMPGQANGAPYVHWFLFLPSRLPALRHRIETRLGHQRS